MVSVHPTVPMHPECPLSKGLAVTAALGFGQTVPPLPARSFSVPCATRLCHGSGDSPEAAVTALTPQ